MGGLNLADGWEAIADALPDQGAIRFGDQELTYREWEDRSARVAGLLREHGIGRGERVCLYLFNGPEYLESEFGILKERAIPANVNYRYGHEELQYLLADADAAAIVFDHSLVDQVDRARQAVPTLRLAVQVGGNSTPEWAVNYENALATAVPAPRLTRSAEDLWFLYTGGTTGMPKAVMWTHAGLMDSFTPTFEGLGAAPPGTLEELASVAVEASRSSRRTRLLTAAPLMHGTGNTTAKSTLSHGGLVSLLTSRRFDADEAWRRVVSDGTTMLVIVGDAFAKPMLDALDAAMKAGRPYDLASLRVVFSSGVILSASSKERLLGHHRMTIIDALGSSEALGGSAMEVSSRSRPSRTGRFVIGPNTKVFADDGTEVTPGSGRSGRVAQGSPLPLGYWKDPDKTAETFPTIGGRRWSLSGDYATLDAAGAIVFLGRGSACINTGGEKVYPEEVEEVLKAQPGVRDCNVVGLPDERWGNIVAAVVSVEPGAHVDVDAMLASSAERLAGYKLPRLVSVVDEIQRRANGKADYEWAREVLAAAPQESEPA